MKYSQKAKDPAFWAKVRSDPAYRTFVDRLLESYEKLGREPIREISYDAFMHYHRTGTREVFEGAYMPRRTRMRVCATLALIFPEEETYLRELMNVIWAICGEYCWSLPNHTEDSEFTYNDDYIDLCTAETGYALALLVLAVGILATCRNFRPVQQITEKYGKKGELIAEWESIDAFIGNLITGSEQNIALLQRQYLILREQTLHMILTGNYTARVAEYMEFFDICQGAAFDVLLYLRLPSAEAGQLGQDIEGLSGDGMTLYAGILGDEELGVLIAMEEEYQLDEAEGMLQSLLEARSLAGDLAARGVYDSMEALVESAAAMRQAAKQKEPEPEAAPPEPKPEKPAARPNHLARQALEYIGLHFADYELSLDKLAHDLQVSPGYLSRIIKQETGESYKDCLVRLRMEEAKRLLQNSHISVADVCTQVGYTNVSHFIKIFQRHTGLPPAKYRDEM